MENWDIQILYDPVKDLYYGFNHHDETLSEAIKEFQEDIKDFNLSDPFTYYGLEMQKSSNNILYIDNSNIPLTFKKAWRLITNFMFSSESSTFARETGNTEDKRNTKNSIIIPINLYKFLNNLFKDNRDEFDISDCTIVYKDTEFVELVYNEYVKPANSYSFDCDHCISEGYGECLCHIKSNERVEIDTLKDQIIAITNRLEIIEKQLSSNSIQYYQNI